MMKKYVKYILSAMALLMLTACGNTDEEETTTTLNTIARTEYVSTEEPSETYTVTTETTGGIFTYFVPGETNSETAVISSPFISPDTVPPESDAIMTEPPFPVSDNVIITAKNLLSSEGGSVISEAPVYSSADVMQSPQIVYGTGYNALNYPIQRGMWLSYLEYDRMMKGQSQDEFTRMLREAFDNMVSIGVNTVYVHLRPFGDAYYNSELFPKGDRLTGGYDPLEIIVKEAHDRGLSVHGWVNPMRLMTDSYMNAMDSKYTLKQWYDSGKNMYKYDGRWYLDPSSEEVRSFICSGVREILSGYDVDGVQIDDYFYPTPDLDWDMKSYEASGKILSHEDFRRESVTKMVKEMCSAVHDENSTAVFGISPSGNAEADKLRLFADVETWCASKECCDYICPQIYYGLEHETYPFEKTLREWQAMCGNGVTLVAGIAAYKAGQEDGYAGRGRNEWVNNSNVVSEEMKVAEGYGCGTALFRYDSLFETKAAEKELNNIKENIPQ